MSARARRPGGRHRAAGTPPLAGAAAAGPHAGPLVRWLTLVLGAAIVLTYANSLSGPFILDDQASIVQNAQIRDLARPDDVLWPAAESPVAGRPLVNLSFALNYAVHGLDVRGYHAVNIALHVTCALLLFALVRRTLALPRLDVYAAGAARELAFAAALLWALHPLASEPVDYLTQRSESMLAAFYLLTLYASLRSATARRPARWMAGAVAPCVMGALSKESMATAPVVVALYDRVFLFGSWRDALRTRGRLYAGLAACWLVVGAVVLSNARGEVVGSGSGVSPWTYLLNQAEIVTHYLRLFAWPRDLVVFYGWPRPLTLVDVWPHALLLAALAIATVLALVRKPAAGFLGAWFFITLAPASSIVPVATEVGAERRMYLPLAALVLLVVMTGWTLLRRTTGARALAAGAVAAGLLAVALATLTMARNREYASPLALARTVVDRRPTGVAHHILAEQLVQAQRYGEAAAHLRQALAMGDSRAGHLLGGLLFNEGKVDEASPVLEAFIRTSELPYRLVPRWLEPPVTEVVTARLWLAQAAASRGNWARAAMHAERILAAVPSHAPALRLLADARFEERRWADAHAHYLAYLRLRPADTQTLLNLGVAQVGLERLDEAIATFRRAAEADPANTRARQLLEMALSDRAAR